MAYFTVFIETHFQDLHARFMSRILTGKSLNEINACGVDVWIGFLKCLLQMALAQALMTVFFLSLILPFMDINSVALSSAPLLRIACVNILLQMLFQSIIIFLYYYDYQWEVLSITLSTAIVAYSTNFAP